jgi:hypothetical protein
MNLVAYLFYMSSLVYVLTKCLIQKYQEGF